MTEYRYLVTYKGGPFVKTVYAQSETKAQTAIEARYQGDTDFEIIRLLDPGETDPSWTDPHYRGA